MGTPADTPGHLPGLLLYRPESRWTSAFSPHEPVILYPLQDEFRLGEPMHFRVVVQGWKSVTRDFQDIAFCRDILEIQGPDGKKIPDSGPPCSTWGKPIRLLPFQTLLAGEGDILLKYSLVEEGEYTIQVKRLAEDLPESNVVTFRVEGGTVPEVEGLVTALRTVAPKYWSVGRASYEFESYTDESGHEVKGIWIDVMKGKNRVTLLFTKTETEYRLESKRVRWEHFGRNEHGHFYGYVFLEKDEFWPTYREDVRRALELKKSEANSDLHSRLPEGFEKDFIIPDADKDQHGNPVVTRHYSRTDPATGYPYEIWLKNPTIEFVLIPAGEFMMGSPDSDSDRSSDEGPVHRVRIEKTFYLAKYEVTQAQWEVVMESNPSDFKNAGKDAPVEQVSWDDCMEFCRKTGLSMPMEVQWEYACRSGTTTRFNLGDGYTDLGRAGWYSKNSGGLTHPVGKKTPNAWGLYDMHGNVFEWCEDEWHNDYNPTNESEWLSGRPGRVRRGGCWFTNAYTCRSAYRDWDPPSNHRFRLGFRPSRQLR